MIPIQLTIEGLYSYQEKQVIDFTKLIEAGLFGIFGRVGSGKSSILEAISFGLYGETERMNKTDNRAYNMMNLKSNRSLIDFEFYNFKDEKYRIYREFKRNSKRFEDVKRSEAILYKWEKDEWIPKPDLNIQEVIGLSYENFKRTIIIPQGQFKEFLELGGKARTDMLQQIFGLDRFDLAHKAKNLYSTAKESLNLVEGELKSYQNISAQEIEQKKELHKQEAEKSNILVAQYRSENEQFQKILAVKNDFVTIADKRNELANLEIKLPEIHQQKNELYQFEKIEKAFSSILNEQKITLQNKVEKEEALALQTVEVTNLQQQFDIVENDLKTAEQESKTIEYLKEEYREFQLIKEIKKAENNRKTLLLNLSKSEEFIKEAKQSVIALNKELLEQQNLLLSLKNQRIETSVLMEINSWFARQENILADKQKWQVNHQKLQQEISENEKDIADLKFKNPQKWQAEIANYKQVFNQSIQKIEEELGQLKVKEQLANYTHNLHEGEPCLLCGATNHPNILKGENVSELVTQTKGKLEAEKDKLQRLSGYETRATIVFEKQQILIGQQVELQKEQQEINQQELSHANTFIWTIVPKDDKAQFAIIQKQAKDSELQIEALEKQIEAHKVEVDNKREKVEEIEKGITENKIVNAGIESEIYTKKAQIIRLQWEEFIAVEETVLDEQLQQRLAEIQRIEQTYKKLSEQYSILSPQLASAKTLLESKKLAVNEIKLKVKELELTIEGLLKHHQLSTVEDAQLILNKNIDLEQQRNSIQAFEMELEVVRNSVKELEQKLAGIAFNINEFAQQEEKVTQLEQATNKAKEIVVKLEGEIERLENDWKKKQSLEKELAVIEKRTANLNTLLTMFNGAGFVNYVSTIYLKNLCDMANLRFHRLTNNQLSLQLNDNNDFEIVDYLNEGKTRSVKTLSGGQSFQVSLSLALALAESVQSLSKSNKNFFFIDEGFGTQDTESVNVVFETLNNLQKENRIVGIISHVDELQERIPISLSVVKTERNGSLVSVHNT